MSQLKFGDYISVEKKRFGAPNEHYTHKVIRTLQSNSWAEVPAFTVQKSILHESIEDVVDCICCGVDESEVVRYRLSDVKFLRSDAHDKELEISAYQLSQQNIINAFGIKGEGAHSKLVIEYVHGLVAENARAVDAVTVFSKVTEEITEVICDEIGHEKVAEILGAFNDLGNMPNTDAAIAEIKSQGIDKWIESRSGRWNGTTKEAEEFATNLRAGRKG